MGLCPDLRGKDESFFEENNGIVVIKTRWKTVNDDDEGVDTRISVPRQGDKGPVKAHVEVCECTTTDPQGRDHCYVSLCIEAKKAPRHVARKFRELSGAVGGHAGLQPGVVLSYAEFVLKIREDLFALQ